jgi:hypothetical protein
VGSLVTKYSDPTYHLCEKCGCVVNEMDAIKHLDEFGIHVPCPSCGGDQDMESAAECISCGAVTPMYQLTMDGWCRKCNKGAVEAYNALIDTMDKPLLDHLIDEYGDLHIESYGGDDD